MASGRAPARGTDSCDSDSCIIPEDELSRLGQLVESLRRENAQLRGQFDQTVGLTNGMQQLYRKNSKLAESLHSVRSENTDLASRLEISTKRNDELVSQHAAERQASIQQHSQETAQNELQFHAFKRRCKSIIHTLESRLKTAENEKTDRDTTISIMSNKERQLIQNAARYFGTNFVDIDAIIGFLSNPPLPPPPLAVQSPRDGELERECRSIKSKCARLKQLLSESNDRCTQLAAEKVRLRTELSDAAKRHESQFKTLQGQWSDARRELAEMKAQNLKTIQGLASQNQSLESEVISLKKKLAPRTTTPPVIVPAVKKLEVSQSDHSALEELKAALSEKTDELARLVVKKEILQQELVRSERSRSDLQIELDRQRFELTAVQKVNTEAQSEIQSLRAALRTRSDATAPPRKEKRSDALKTKILALDEKVQSQSRAIQELTVERDNERALSAKLQAKSGSLKAELREKEQRLIAISEELSNATLQLQENTAKTADAAIPFHAWRYGDFDASLSKQLDEIGMNQLLSSPSKLAQVYRCIHAFYSGQLSAKDQKLNAVSEAFQHTQEVVNQFSIDLSIALSMNAVNFEDLVYNGFGRQILQRLTDTLHANDELKRLSAEFARLAQHISEEFGDSSDLFARITEVRTKLSDQGAAINARGNTIRELKTKIRDLTAEKTREIGSLNAQNVALTQKIEQLRISGNESAAHIKKLNMELSGLKRAQKDAEYTAAQSEAVLNSDHQRVIDNLTRNHEMVQSQSSRRIAELTGELSRARTLISNHEDSVAKLNRLIETDQKVIAEKTAEIARLQAVNQSDHSHITAQSRAEKEDLVHSYEASLAEANSVCDSLRTELERATTELAESQHEIAKLKATVKVLKQKRNKLEDEVRVLSETVDQDLRAQESIAKSSAINAESSFVRKLHEEKTKFDTEKRRILAKAMEEFRGFVDPLEPIDEHSYRVVLARVKAELKRLSDADNVIRRLVGANPRQATDEAVAQCLMN